MQDWNKTYIPKIYKNVMQSIEKQYRPPLIGESLTILIPLGIIYLVSIPIFWVYFQLYGYTWIAPLFYLCFGIWIILELFIYGKFGLTYTITSNNLKLAWGLFKKRQFNWEEIEQIGILPNKDYFSAYHVWGSYIPGQLFGPILPVSGAFNSEFGTIGTELKPNSVVILVLKQQSQSIAIVPKNPKGFVQNVKEISPQIEIISEFRKK